MINDYYVKFEEVNNLKEEHVDEYDELKDYIKKYQGNTITIDAYGAGERSIKQVPNNLGVGSQSMAIKDDKKPFLNFIKKKLKKGKDKNRTESTVTDAFAGGHDL